MIKKDIDTCLFSNIFNEYKDGYKLSINDFTHIYAYYLDDKIVGFLIFSIIYDKCEIIDLFVSKDYRNRKIAQSLINEILLDYDLENITLEVSEENIAAIKLYEKMGFKKVAVRKNYYKNCDGFLMLKEVR